MAQPFDPIVTTGGRVAVVGAGLAGLAAALELQQAGWEVELFERSRLLGGRATSYEVEGHVVDNGQHIYLACCTEFVDFVRRVGMEHALHLQERFDVVAYSKHGAGRLRAANLPAPLHLLASFASYRHLSPRGKLQVARALLTLMVNPKSARAGMSFAQWLRARGQGRDALRAFWEPFMVPALNAPLERMNAADAAFVISTAFLTERGAARFGYSRVPLAHIMERAAARLHATHRSRAVLAVETQPHGIVLRTAQEELCFDAAVLAVSPRALARMLGEPSRWGIPPLDAYQAFPIVDVHLWHDAGSLHFDFAALLDAPVLWVFQKAPGYLCCSISAAHELVTKANAEIVAQAWEEARGALPDLARASLIRGAATRSPEGTYIAAPGVSRPGPRTDAPNVMIAGAWTATGWPDTMESAVRSGLIAARALLEGVASSASHAELLEA
jgi:squalene-associated FAD-dependent desaturase